MTCYCPRYCSCHYWKQPTSLSTNHIRWVDLILNKYKVNWGTRMSTKCLSNWKQKIFVKLFGILTSSMFIVYRHQGVTNSSALSQLQPTFRLLPYCCSTKKCSFALKFMVIIVSKLRHGETSEHGSNRGYERCLQVLQPQRYWLLRQTDIPIYYR